MVHLGESSTGRANTAPRRALIVPPATDTVSKILTNQAVFATDAMAKVS